MYIFSTESTFGEFLKSEDDRYGGRLRTDENRHVDDEKEHYCCRSWADFKWFQCGLTMRCQAATVWRPETIST